MRFCCDSNEIIFQFSDLRQTYLFETFQAVLAEYGRRRLSRNCVAEDPRLVDMDDVSKKERDNCNNVESNWSSLQNNDFKLENFSLNRINDANNPLQRTSPLLSPPSPMFDPSSPNAFFSSRPPSARGQLRPISRETYTEQARRRASLNSPIISPLESESFSCGCSTKEDNEPLFKDFVDSCTESFNALKKGFQEKAVSHRIIYITTLLYSEWPKAVLFFFVNTVHK